MSHFLFLLLSILTVLDILVMVTSEDWTNCPDGCTCKWISGKKSAICKGANFKSIPTNLSPEIQMLDLSYNSMKTLNSNVLKIHQLLSLHKLYFKSCGIKEVDRNAFSGLTILIELDLSDNDISIIHQGTFTGNYRLRLLILSGNPITKLLPRTFPPLQYLQKLYLSNCELSSISQSAFRSVTNLELLDLSGNNLTTLVNEPFLPLLKLKTFSIHDNPWDCDCKLVDFKNWFINSNLYFIPTKCRQPERLRGQQWKSIKDVDFACKPHITSHHKFVITRMGKNVTLNCEMEANPTPKVKWVFKGRIITNQSDTNFIIQSRTFHSDDKTKVFSNLTILEVNGFNLGDYICVASNTGGVVEANISLLLQREEMMKAAKEQPDSQILIIYCILAGGLSVIFLGILVCLCFALPVYKKRAQLNRRAHGANWKKRKGMMPSTESDLEIPLHPSTSTLSKAFSTPSCELLKDQDQEVSFIGPSFFSIPDTPDQRSYDSIISCSDDAEKEENGRKISFPDLLDISLPSRASPFKTLLCKTFSNNSSFQPDSSKVCKEKHYKYSDDDITSLITAGSTSSDDMMRSNHYGTIPQRRGIRSCYKQDRSYSIPSARCSRDDLYLETRKHSDCPGPKSPIEALLEEARNKDSGEKTFNVHGVTITESDIIKIINDELSKVVGQIKNDDTSSPAMRCKKREVPVTQHREETRCCESFHGSTSSQKESVPHSSQQYCEPTKQEKHVTFVLPHEEEPP